ncbi:MAG: LicD family protein [Clostridia bacterium]|nr:LicD family protein [Clostridia bacterium]
MGTSLSVEQFRPIMLNILSEIDEICRNNGINYSLCGGSLLGAIRHKGFIPWDDDIDIFMPRPDYEKFLSYCQNNKTNFGLLCSDTNEKYGYLFAKAYDTSTVIKEDLTLSKNFEIGVYVDVFPIDGLADTYEQAIKVFNKTKFKRELLVARNWDKFERSKTRAWYYEPIRFGFFLISRLSSKKKLVSKIQKVYKKIDFYNVEYVGTICGSYRNKEIMKREIYEGYIDVEFEGKTFKAIKNYDSYLSGIYGDYMKLPPKEKQVSHHYFTAYWRE